MTVHLSARHPAFGPPVSRGPGLSPALRHGLPSTLGTDLLLSSGVLFRTVHGSRLYGLARPGSDWDEYVVVPEPRDVRPGYRAHRREHAMGLVTGPDGVEREVDAIVIGLGTWLEQCENGVPQALEAMFSTLATPGPLDSFRSSYRVSPGRTAAYFCRAAWSHADHAAEALAAGDEAKALKKRRHAVRYALNLADALACGRFDPTLDAAHQRRLDEAAASADGFGDRLTDLLGAMRPRAVA